MKANEDPEVLDTLKGERERLPILRGGYVEEPHYNVRQGVSKIENKQAKARRVMERERERAMELDFQSYMRWLAKKTEPHHSSIVA